VRNIVNGLLVRDGAVLLARRAPHRAAHADRWSFPGGHVEPGETLEAALIRELGEEIGVTPTRYAPAGTIADPDIDDPATYHMFIVSDWQGEPELRGDEHTALRWCGLQEAAALHDLALEAYRPLLSLCS